MQFRFRLLSLIGCLWLSYASVAQYQNVYVGEGSEVSIMMDPNNPANMVAGANIDYYFYSSDSGKSWIQGNLRSSHGVWGDPVLIVDDLGDFYYFHLTGDLDKIVCQKSTDGGATWNDGTFPINTDTTDQDKEWALFDPSSKTIHCMWSSLDDYISSDTLDSSRIYSSFSMDYGLTWSDPVRVSKTAGNCGYNSIKGSVPAMGPNGELYAAWTGNGIDFQRSTDVA